MVLFGSFGFEGAMNLTGGYWSNDSDANVYWDVDNTTLPCETLYTALIPVRSGSVLASVWPSGGT